MGEAGLVEVYLRDVVEVLVVVGSGDPVREVLGIHQQQILLKVIMGVVVILTNQEVVVGVVELRGVMVVRQEVLEVQGFIMISPVLI